ncbi:hypothetical protein OG21DRAFT_1316935 [Imleria badia]|nr:hypothetical protein OG21DRAFT_1316935 [Imleria badia]
MSTNFRPSTCPAAASREGSRLVLEATHRELEKLNIQAYLLGEGNDRIKEESDHLREYDAVQQERHEALASTLKQKVDTLKTQLQLAKTFLH